MNRVIIYGNALDRSEHEVFENVNNVAELLVTQFASFPSSARVYLNQVAIMNDVTPHDEASIEKLLTLKGDFYVIVYPQGVELVIGIVAVVIAAISVGLQFLLKPKSSNQGEQSPNNELGDRQNKARPNERIPWITGTVRAIPDQIMLPYKFFVNNAEFEDSFMCIGVGTHDILDCNDGTTPVDDIQGEFVAVYGPNSSPNSRIDSPQTTFGTEPVEAPPLLAVLPVSAVNGQILRAPNAGNFTTNNNMSFKYGGLILSNDASLDFTQYFTASTPGNNQYITIAANGDGINASDPAGLIGSVSLAGTYLITSVAAGQIVVANSATVNANWNTLASFSGQQSTFYHTFAVTGSGNPTVGPFLVNSPNMTDVMSNFVVTGGLYAVDNKGRQVALTVTIRMDVQAADSAGNPVGDVISGTINITGSTVTRSINGATLHMGLPTTGAVLVSATRITPKGTDTRNQYSEQVQWRDLFGVSSAIFGPPKPPFVTSIPYAYAFPTVVESAGVPGANAGNAVAVATTSDAKLSQTSSSPTGNWGVYVKWSGFRMPDLPADAVIQYIQPVVVARASLLNDPGTFRPELDGAVSSAGVNMQNPNPIASGDTVGTSIIFPSGSTSHNIFDGVYSTSDLVLHSQGNTAALVASTQVGVRSWQTGAAAGYSQEFDVMFVALAVYYTSGEPYPVNGRTSVGDFGNVTTVRAITAQTVDSTSVKERKLNLLVTRCLPTWINRTASGAPQFSTTLYPTNNAADIACAMALDKTFGRRSVSEIDVPGIYAIADSSRLGGEHVDGEIVSYFGNALMSEFCYTFDDSQVSFEQGMAMLGQAINCTAYRKGSLMSLFFEKLTADSTLLFNHRNKLPDTEKRTVSFGPLNDNDGIQYTYTDPNAVNYPNVDSQVTLYYPQDQSAINPKKIDSKGVRNPVQAQVNAWRLFQKLQLANTQVEFTSTREAAELIVNERILVADETRTGTQTGEINGASGLIVNTSQQINFVAGHTYTIFLQLSDGSVESMPVTAGIAAKTATLDHAPSLDLVYDFDRWAKTTYWVIDNGAVGQNKRAMAFLLQEKNTGDNATFTLKAINSDDNYYAHDTDIANGLIPVPIAGYLTQGYTGIGLVKQDGTTYVPPARSSFSSASYAGSGLAGSNNTSTPNTAGAPVAPVSGGTLTFNGTAAPAQTDITDATPAASAGYQNAKWNRTGNSDSQSASASVPATGGASVKTASYLIAAADCGLTVVFNSATAVTCTLPAAIPFAKWNVSVQNIGVGKVTFASTLNVDGAAVSLALTTGQGCSIATDGTSYYTERGVASGGSSSAPTIMTSQARTIAFGSNANNMKGITIHPVVNVTLTQISAAIQQASGTQNQFMIYQLSNNGAAPTITAILWTGAIQTPGVSSVSGLTIYEDLTGANIQLVAGNTYAIVLQCPNKATTFVNPLATETSAVKFAPGFWLMGASTYNVENPAISPAVGATVTCLILSNAFAIDFAYHF